MNSCFSTFLVGHVEKDEKHRSNPDSLLKDLKIAEKIKTFEN